jgi:hypothetical protein
MPGVTSAALAELVPMSNHMDSEAIVPEGYQLPKGQSAVRRSRMWSATTIFAPRTFRFCRVAVPRKRQRQIAPRGGGQPAPSRRLTGPGQNPIGKRFRLGGPQGDWVEVVGLARSQQVQLADRTADRVPLPAAFAELPHADDVAGGDLRPSDDSRSRCAGWSSPCRCIWPCFRPRVQHVERRQIVQPLVIQRSTTGVHQLLHLHEIHQQPDGIQFRDPPRHLAAVVVAMHVLALALCNCAARVRRRKSLPRKLQTSKNFSTSVNWW